MTAVAHETNRPWDGPRLLRFLTGLAVLALAVTLRLSGPAGAPLAEPAPQPAVTTVTAAPDVTSGSPAARSTAPAERRRPTVPARPPLAGPATSARPAPVAPPGAVPATGDSRAPPTR
ncbi:hypothetical protein [Actinoplanes teichomyceticus]|uniref:Uncharacterized protein n=1 Tax=Actinoplanes teichomyceticus TaxID=1867 RepID=A0A561VRW0_ACTTI|nr:hypothetical protein [Actinoplanes teichomyceticus]TWG14354.1 hypothetical protein FHX34_104654 [Actinoplanes teichomyceticus]GIF13088.1 hypothetical protein Ate01nite_31200 [Actinoplanes teichomyceticus]